MGPRRSEQDPASRRSSMTSSKTQKHKTNRRDRSEENWSPDEQGTEEIATNGGGSQEDRNHAAFDSNINVSPLSQLLDDSVSRMQDNQKAITLLTNGFAKYSNDIKQIPEIQKKFADLEAQCRSKDEMIEKQNNILDTLFEKIAKKDSEVAGELEKLEEGKKTLEKEKDRLKIQELNAEKRQKAIVAEIKNKHEKVLEIKEADLMKEHTQRAREIEETKKKWENDHKEIMKSLEKSCEEANRKTADMEEKLGVCSEQLSREKVKFEDLQAAKSNYRAQVDILKTKVRDLENEFSLSGNPDEHYKDQFSKLFNKVRLISDNFFGVELSDRTPQELSTISEKLNVVDTSFCSVPISTSDDSRDLRNAHANRIISSALHKNILQPFSSDRTLPDTKLAALLQDIYSEVSKNSRKGKGTGRAAHVWKATTIHALESLFANKEMNSKTNTPKKVPSITPMSRADKVIEDVLVLSPLLTASQESQLRNELFLLSEFTSSLWMSAQAEEPDFRVSSSLDPKNIHEWHSKEFDPPSMHIANEESKEIVIGSATRPRIYTLSPQITIEKLSKPATVDDVMPGSYPNAEQHVVSTEMVCIYAGEGLPEGSELVLSGKKEVEDEKRDLEIAVENMLKKRIQRRSTNGGGGRRASTANSNTGVLSPSEIWNRQTTIPVED